MPRSGLSSLAISLAALLGAVALRWLLDPALRDTLPLVTLFGAVADRRVGRRMAARRGRRGARVLGVQRPLHRAARHARPSTTPSNVGGPVAYVFTCALIIAIGEAMRRARSHAGERGELLRVTLASIGDAVITTDVDGRVTYLNAVAEALTGWSRRDAEGRPLDEVFRIVGERDRTPADNPAMRALREGTVVGFANHTVLIAKDGTERPIDDSAAPIRDEGGTVSGCVLIFRDVDHAAAAASRTRPSRLAGGAPARVDRRDVRRRDHPQVARRHDPELERRGRAAVRLHRRSRRSGVTSRS